MQITRRTLPPGARTAPMTMPVDSGLMSDFETVSELCPYPYGVLW